VAQVKTVQSRAKEICGLCDDRAKCSGCTITVKHENNIVVLNGRTKEIKEVMPCIGN
jgi:hypothetical protein